MEFGIAHMARITHLRTVLWVAWTVTFEPFQSRELTFPNVQTEHVVDVDWAMAFNAVHVMPDFRW